MIATASYATAQRSRLTIVQTSVGMPKWLAPLPQLDAAKPTGIFGQGLDWPEYRERYLQRLAERWDELEHDLHGLTREWHRIALCCWCRDASTCHRRLLADVIEDHGLGPVHEVSPASGTPVHAKVNLPKKEQHAVLATFEPEQLSLTEESPRD
ncbi:MAG: DUF488 family protein [Thermoleophilia bacterium]